MPINKIYGQLSCSNFQTSVRWFETLFGRLPDAQPMRGLAEWHRGEHAGFQLFENAKDAGHGTLTLIVDGLQDEHARLREAGMAPGDIESGTEVEIVRLRDPDENLVVLAQPRES